MLDLFSGIYQNKKILLTGNTGFKGSWMSIWLKELGAEVYGYALAPLTPQDNFVTTGLAEKIHHQDGDVRDLEHLQKYFNEIKPDMAFHLAAQPLVIDSYKNPHYNFETNLMGTVNFLESVRNCPSVKVAINITTDKCYQNNEWDWGYREIDPMGGDDPYSASKGCSELITHAYTRSFFNKPNSPKIASGRAGNVIGGGDWAVDRIIPDLIRAYSKKETAFVRNSDSVRPWQFVLEPIYGYLKLAEKLFFEGEKFVGGWNFGPATYENYTVGQVIDEVKKILPKLQITSPEQKEKLHEAGLLKLDVTKAVNQLAWHPKLTFVETIQFTIDGYIKELEGSNNLYQNRVEQINKYCSK